MLPQDVFYQAVGRRIVERHRDDVPDSRGSFIDDAECGVCGRRGEGIFDRSLKRTLCLPCWSLFQPAPGFFGNRGKQTSFHGKVQSAWLAHAGGVDIFVSEKTLADLREKQASGHPDGVRLTIPEFRYRVLPRILQLREIAAGRWPEPFLYVSAYQPNKLARLGMLALSCDGLVAICGSDSVEFVRRDRMVEIFDRVKATDEAAALRETREALQKLSADAADRFRAVAALRRLGWRYTDFCDQEVRIAFSAIKNRKLLLEESCQPKSP